MSLATEFGLDVEGVGVVEVVLGVAGGGNGSTDVSGRRHSIGITAVLRRRETVPDTR